MNVRRHFDDATFDDWILQPRVNNYTHNISEVFTQRTQRNGPNGKRT